MCLGKNTSQSASVRATRVHAADCSLLTKSLLTFCEYIGQSRELRVKCLRMGVVSERSGLWACAVLFPHPLPQKMEKRLSPFVALSRKEIFLCRKKEMQR